MRKKLYERILIKKPKKQQLNLVLKSSIYIYIYIYVCIYKEKLLHILTGKIQRKSNQILQLKFNFAPHILNYLFLERVLFLNFGVKYETKAQRKSNQILNWSLILHHVSHLILKFLYQVNYCIQKSKSLELMNIKIKNKKNVQFTFSTQ